MKSLFKKIFNSRYIVFFRNLFSLKEIPINSNNIEKFNSISDAFIWRTDNRYKTIFRYGDLLKYFFNDNTSIVEILIYDKSFQLLKKITLSNILRSNELVIDKELLGNIEEYGTFYIFHKGGEQYKTKIRNSCYTGYSLNLNLPSFVHGNCPSIKKNDKKINNSIVGKSLLVNQYYKLQKKIDKRMMTEVTINNPTSGKVNFYINGQKHYLAANCTNIIQIKNAEIIEILSNCYFLRPVIFTTYKHFLDVHHG